MHTAFGSRLGARLEEIWRERHTCLDNEITLQGCWGRRELGSSRLCAWMTWSKVSEGDKKVWSKRKCVLIISHHTAASSLNTAHNKDSFDDNHSNYQEINWLPPQILHPTTLLFNSSFVFSACILFVSEFYSIKGKQNFSIKNKIKKIYIFIWELAALFCLKVRVKYLGWQVLILEHFSIFSAIL